MPNITISDETFAKLQGVAEAFVDTPDSTMSRVLDFYKLHHKATAKAESKVTPAANIGMAYYSMDAPPDLLFTRPLSIQFDGKQFEKSKCYWNPLLYEVVAKAAGILKNKANLKTMLLCNYKDGESEGAGYHFIQAAGLSIQAQAANPAWKTISHIVRQLGLSIQVTFVWENNPKALHPGQTGAMVYPGK